MSFPDAGLTRLSLTFGAIADLLAAHDTGVERAGVSERARLSASLEATLHVAARATLMNCGRYDAQPLEAAGRSLERLSQLTELAALLPPSARVSALEQLNTRRTEVGTLEERVAAWGQLATTVLSGDAQLTGYALQSTALVIANICNRAAQTVQAFEANSRQSDLPGLAATYLEQSASGWMRAAAWPEHIRLGGRSRELRLASTDVIRALAVPANPSVSHLITLQAAVHLASNVGAAHPLCQP